MSAQKKEVADQFGVSLMENIICYEVVFLKTPELFELEYLFECDAQLSEDGIPWQYTSVSFYVIRDKVKAEFDFEEASRSGQIRLYLYEEELTKIILENIKDITIRKSNDFESLVLEFDEENYVKPLVLQTKPRINMTWGTSLELRR
ncbi:hypothetical protein FE782_00835 [Paenibacillus antri]|uniref:Uncharacterized protein n=1 Tax=Paenibacillus antri TaxID=2582848 RepID=A0A5R9GDT9_9BACL|nr:hypothetical protein [Paenibacillus antri]TLS53931.1 hypothetical protein FE782_00835 [Paenibacillus antri]